MGLASRHCLAIGFTREFSKTRIDDVINRLADDFPFGRADEALILRIAAQKSAVDVLQPHEIGNGLHQGAQLSLAVAKVAIREQAGQAVGKPPADFLEQPLLLLRPNPWERALMQPEHIGLIRLGGDGHAKHGLNAPSRRQPCRRHLLGPRIEGHGAARSPNGRHHAEEFRIHRKLDPWGERLGIFGAGSLHWRSQGRGLGPAWIHQKGSVASEDRKRRVENLAHHRPEILRLLDRQIDPIHAFEEMQIGLKLSVYAFALDASAQHHDAERQIAGQFLEEPNFLRDEGVRLGGINVESPECDRSFVLERKGDAGLIASAQSFGAPRGGPGVRGEILGADGFPGANGGSDGPASPFRIRPGDPGLIDIAVIESGASDGAHRLGFVVFGKSHPRHVVAGLVANNSADVVEQGLFVHRPHQGLVTAADGSQFAIQAPQRVLRPLPLGNTAYNMKHTVSFPFASLAMANPFGLAEKGERLHRSFADRRVIPDCDRNERTASCPWPAACV